MKATKEEIYEYAGSSIFRLLISLMKATKEEIYGYAGSSIFCLLISLTLYRTYIETTIKAEEMGILVEIKAGEEKIPVNFGTVNLSSGTVEPGKGKFQNETKIPIPVKQTVPTPKTPPAVKQKTQNNTAPIITQNVENTVAIEAAQKEAARKEKEEKDRIEAEQRAQQAKVQEEQRKRDAINQQVSGAFGSAATAQNQRGTGTTGSGVQGNPNSTTSAGSPSGTGYGNFNLSGRTLGAGGLPRPAYNVQEEGRIVINITVDPKGNVILAEIGKGTDIDNNNLRKSALEAARKTKFNSIDGNNNQSGTITYRYSLK